MPIALLLQETVYTFRWGAYHLEPWSHLVQTQELLIDRARGAFLTRWFGAALPLDGAYLRVVVGNLDELRARWLVVTKPTGDDAGGQNLLEPLAGLTGELAGAALSPTFGFMVAAVILRKWPAWARVLLAGLLGTIGGPVIVGFVGILFLPAVLVGSALVAIRKPEELRSAYQALGAVTRFIVSLFAFVKVLMRPRQAITNPLLSALLELFDKVAGLIPFVLAFVAILVTRIGPLIAPLAAQVAPFADLIEEVRATVGGERHKDSIFYGVRHLIEHLLGELRGAASFALEQLGLLFPALGIVFGALFDDLSELLRLAMKNASGHPPDWSPSRLFSKLEEALKAVFVGHPLMRPLSAAKTIVRIVDPSPSSSKLPAYPTTSAESVAKSLGGPPPGGLSAIETLARIDLKYGGALFGDSLALSPEIARAVERAKRPRSLFAEERERLARRPVKTPAEAVAEHPQYKGLRDALLAVVEGVLPEQMRVRKDQLLAIFGLIDEKVFAQRPIREQPVKALRDNGMLRPIVKRLVIRATSGTKDDLELFKARFVARLAEQRYPAPA